MKVVILCGGFGTRIRDVAEDIPKPMIRIGRYPILWHIMKRYASYGHKEFILCLGHKSQVIKDFFLNYDAHTADFTIVLGQSAQLQFHKNHKHSDWTVTLAETGMNAMTGARVHRIRDYIGQDEEFMLTYGDGVGDIDIEKLMAFHRKKGKVLTVTGVRPPGRFGEIVASPDGLVSEFNEKPQATAGRISGGFFVCNRRLFDYLNDQENLVFEEGPMNQLVADRQMALYPHDGFWQPMDTSREYQLLNDIYARDEAPWER